MTSGGGLNILTDETYMRQNKTMKIEQSIMLNAYQKKTVNIN